MWQTLPPDVTKRLFVSSFSDHKQQFKFDGITRAIGVKNMVATSVDTGSIRSLRLAWVRPQDVNPKFADEKPGQEKPRLRKRRLG